MKMIFIKCFGLLVLVFLCDARRQICDFTHKNVRQCPNYNLVQAIAFHAYIPASLLDATCQHLQDVLSCVYINGRLDECESSYRFPFDIQRDVVKAVCGDRKQEYLRSAQCFNTVGLKARIAHNCFTALVNKTLQSSDQCGTVSLVTECAMTNVIMTDGCDVTDAALMKDLTDIYLQHTRDIFRCSKAGRVIDRATSQHKIRDQRDKNTSMKTSVRTLTSVKPETVSTRSIYRSSDKELPPRIVVAIEKQETQRTVAQKLPVTISNEDIEYPSDLSQADLSDVDEETHEDKDSRKESTPSSYRPLSQESSYSSSKHFKTIPPAEISSGVGHLTLKPPDLKNLTTAASRSSSSSSIVPDEPRNMNQKLQNQTTEIPIYFMTHENKNVEVTAEASMSTQGSSARVHIYTLPQVSLLLVFCLIFTL